MRNKKAPFKITSTTIDYVVEIAELIGKASLSRAAKIVIG